MPEFGLVLEKILSRYRQYIDNAYQLPEFFVNILLIHASLLNVSYIFYESQSTWIYCIVVVVRPSIIIKVPQCFIYGICYIVLQLIYNLRKGLPGSSYLALINCLLKVGLLNFVIEQFDDIQSYAVGAIVLFIQIFDLLFIQGTLDVNTNNFQLTQITLLTFITFILNMLMMILYKFNFKIEILQILALINSAFCTLDLLLTQNQRCRNTRLIMITIQLTTFYLGILQFIHFENSYSLILVPFYFKLISFVKFSDFIFTKDPIINASILLKQQKFYECFIILNKLKEENFVRAVKRNVLLKKCVDKINQTMQLKLENQNLLGVANRLIQNDIKNIKLSQDILQIVELKIQLLQNWKTNDFEQIYDFVTKVLKVKKEIDKYYCQYPYGMVQSLICFYYAEILNDLLEANEMIMHANKSADTFFRSTFESKNMFYIITKYENGTLILDKVSSNAPQHICNKKIQDLIPSGIREQHSKLVDQFLVTGQSKYVRQLHENYLNTGNYLEVINFAIDLTYVNSVSFICLIVPSTYQKNTLIVNDQYLISSMTNELQTFANNSNMFTKGTSIFHIIPDLQKVEDSCFLENVLVSQNHLSKSRLGFSEDQTEEISYLCDIEIKVRKISNSYAYMMLQFDNIKTHTNQVSTKREAQSAQSVKTVKSIGSSSDKQLSIAEEIQKNQNEFVTSPAHVKEQNEDYIKRAFNMDLVQPQVITSRGEPEYNLLLSHQRTDSKKQSIKSMSPLHKKQEEKKYNEDQKRKNKQFDREDGSQVSSIRLLRNSKLFRKYDLFNKFCKHMPLKRHHQLIVILFAMSLVLQGLFIVLQLTSLNLIAFASDIYLLEIKNLFFQPLDLFLVTRWNLWTLNFQRTNKIITPAQYTEQAAFSLSNLGLGFDSLNDNLKSFMFRSELQGLLQQKYIEAYSYVDTFKYDQYNMTLRTAISVLLNFQYILKMNYIYEKTVKADSPQIFYSFMNYPILRDMMKELNEDIMLATLARGKTYEDLMATLFIFEEVFLVLLVILIFFTKRYINKKLILFLNLSQYSSGEAIQFEINKFKQIHDLLVTDNSYKFNYYLDLDEKENQFKTEQGDKGIKNQKSVKKKKIPSFQFIAILILFSFIITVNGIINYIEFNNYLIKYPETAVYKKQLSDLSGDIPLMFAQREVLYGRKNYMYLDSAYFDKIFYYVKESLNSTIHFSSYDPNFDKMLVTHHFTDFYQEIALSDLCGYLPEEMGRIGGSICPIILGQNMRHGLKAMLIYIGNLMSTDMAINNFTYRALPTVNELDGAFMVSIIINVINQLFYDDLITLTTQLVNQQEIFNICYFIVLFVIFLLIITIVRENIYKNSKVIIHFVYLIPTQTLFNDDTFERTLRTLINF